MNVGECVYNLAMQYERMSSNIAVQSKAILASLYGLTLLRYRCSDGIVTWAMIGAVIPGICRRTVHIRMERKMGG